LRLFNMAKRMSMEEKKRLALVFLHESKSVFSPKELPELLYREKKISKSSGEAVLKELEGDSLIRIEKIGISNYAWSFPSEQRIRAQTREKALQTQNAELDEEILLWQERKKKAESTRCHPNRPKALSGLRNLLDQNQALEQEIAVKQQFDPDTLKMYDKNIEMGREAADRWTTNVFSIIQYLKQCKGWSNSEALKKLGLTQDFDYLE